MSLHKFPEWHMAQMEPPAPVQDPSNEVFSSQISQANVLNDEPPPPQTATTSSSSPQTQTDVSNHEPSSPQAAGDTGNDPMPSSSPELATNTQRTPHKDLDPDPEYPVVVFMEFHGHMLVDGFIPLKRSTVMFVRMGDTMQTLKAKMLRLLTSHMFAAGKAGGSLGWTWAENIPLRVVWRSNANDDIPDAVVRDDEEVRVALLAMRARGWIDHFFMLWLGTRRRVLEAEVGDEGADDEDAMMEESSDVEDSDSEGELDSEEDSANDSENESDESET